MARIGLGAKCQIQPRSKLSHSCIISFSGEPRLPRTTFFATAKGITTMTVAAPPSVKLTNHINGQWATSQASEWRDVINPATGDILASVPLAGAADVNAA